MSRDCPLASVGLFFALGMWSLILASPAASQGSESVAKPMEVMTDTPEYCRHLFDRVSKLVRLAAAPVPREVTNLTTEGQRMCAQGQTRGGIMRLRSALMMMEKPNGPAYR